MVKRKLNSLGKLFKDIVNYENLNLKAIRNYQGFAILRLKNKQGKEDLGVNNLKCISKCYELSH